MVVFVRVYASNAQADPFPFLAACSGISFRLASMSPLTSDVVVDLVVRVRRGKLPSPRLESGLSVSSLLQSPAFLFGVMLTLFCAAAAEGHHLLLYFYTPDHALEEVRSQAPLLRSTIKEA